MAFYVGQKVVCVDADSPGITGGYIWEKGEEIFNGRIYTVSRTWIDYWGYAVVDLVEVKRVQGTRPCPIGYGVFRFRPLVEKSTDTGMAILREILDRESVEERKPQHVNS